jgi:multimeric flavodoxin WrbA
LKEALGGASNCGADTELLTFEGRDIKPCDGCFACAKTGKCHINDEMQAIYAKLQEADGIIFATPVYFYSVTAQAKAIIDRCYALTVENKLTNKIGGVISVASSFGHLEIWNTFNRFFAVNHMLSADLVYGYARERGDIIKDKHAMKAALELGGQVVALAESRFEYPKDYDIPIWRLVKRTYGINACPAMGRFD